MNISFFTYIVTLSAAGTDSPTFRGFFIQGRLVADNSPVGTFVDPGAGVRFTSCNPSNVHKRINLRAILIFRVLPEVDEILANTRVKTTTCGGMI